MINSDEQTVKASNEYLMLNALEHYEKAGTAIQCWNNLIPRAIRYYY